MLHDLIHSPAPPSDLGRVLVLHSAGVSPQLGVDVGERHQQVRVVSLHPRLLMQVCNVELAAGRMGEHLIMLLEDLVESHVIQVDELLQCEEVISDSVCLLEQHVLGCFALLLGVGRLGLHLVEVRTQLLHKGLGELVDLIDLWVGEMEVEVG